MTHLEEFRFPYFDGAEKYLNELSIDNIVQIKEKINDGSQLIDLLINDYCDNTFCLQIDYDFMFGDENFRKAFLFFDDAKKCASRDETSYARDKSYIFIYKFQELYNECLDYRKEEYLNRFLKEIEKFSI